MIDDLSYLIYRKFTYIGSLSATNVNTSEVQFTLQDGNSNNRSNAGAFYVNRNNDAENRNWNIRTCQSYLFKELSRMQTLNLTSW